MIKQQSGKKNSGNTRLRKLANILKLGVNRVVKKVSKTPETIMYDFSRPKSEKGKLTKSFLSPNQPNTPPKRFMWNMGNIRFGRPLSLNKVTSKNNGDFEVLTLKKGQGKMKRRRSAKRKSRGKRKSSAKRRSRGKRKSSAKRKSRGKKRKSRQ